jgi:CheY-like chemotaxis protein
MKALIIDDEALARRELRRLLADFAWVDIVGEAANIEEAAAKCDALSPDLLFLDIQMPGGTGFDLLARLRRRDHPRAERRRHRRRSDAQDEFYLIQPVSPSGSAATDCAAIGVTNVAALFEFFFEPGMPTSYDVADHLAGCRNASPVRGYMRLGNLMTKGTGRGAHGRSQSRPFATTDPPHPLLTIAHHTPPAGCSRRGMRFVFRPHPRPCTHRSGGLSTRVNSSKACDQGHWAWRVLMFILSTRFISPDEERADTE